MRPLSQKHAQGLAVINRRPRPSPAFRLFVDDLFVECYFQDGRRAITWGKDGRKPTGDDAITAFANQPTRVRSAVAFELGSMWVALGDLM